MHTAIITISSNEFLNFKMNTGRLKIIYNVLYIFWGVYYVNYNTLSKEDLDGTYNFSMIKSKEQNYVTYVSRNIYINYDKRLTLSSS